jgi:cytosine/adenosine deaminase-related metal-dependent hydrolase
MISSSLRWGYRSVPHARELGLFRAPTLIAHGLWLTERDISLLADQGVAVAHNPVANMLLGSGTSPVTRLRAAGITVGIGTDSAASNDSQDMLQAVKLAALVAKADALDPSVLSARDVLRMATLDGARALGLDDLVGSLEPGKRADLVLLQDTVCVGILHDPCGQLVYGASPRAVRDVWVDGRRVVADHRCVTIDEHDQLTRSRPLASYLAQVSGLSAAAVSALPTTHERRRESDER